MVELCLMASSAYPSGIFRQEKGLQRANKEVRTFFSSPGARQEVIRSGSLHLRPRHLDYPWQPTGHLLLSDKSIKLDSAIRRPVLIDVQDTRPDLVLFSFGIAEQCTRHEKVWQFFMSGSSEAEREGLDYSLLSDFMGLQTLAFLIHPKAPVPLFGDFRPFSAGSNESQSSLIYPWSEIYPQKPVLDFVGDLACGSRIAMHPDGRVLFTGTKSEMKDLMSFFAEFYVPKNSTKWRTKPLLVPHITRLDRSEPRTNIHGSVLQLEAAVATPVKSPRKSKLNQSSKKKGSRKAVSEQGLYQRNSFHAFESLLSLMLGKSQGKTTILSLKQSGPELPQFLTQCSVGIAGTGLAVLFYVFGKVTCGRGVPFCSSKLLHTGVGLGMFWLSWAVNKLRDTIIYISKNQHKLGLKDKDMMKRVDRSVKEIFYSAATVMAVALLKVA